MSKFQEKYEDFLAHYGVPGMEWGADKKDIAAANAAGAARNAARNASRNARRRRLARQAENTSHASSKSEPHSHAADKYYNGANSTFGMPYTKTDTYRGALRNTTKAALARNIDRKSISNMAAEIMRSAKSKKQASSSSSDASSKSSASQEYLKERAANSKKNKYFGR